MKYTKVKEDDTVLNATEARIMDDCITESVILFRESYPEAVKEYTIKEKVGAFMKMYHDLQPNREEVRKIKKIINKGLEEEDYDRISNELNLFFWKKIGKIMGFE